MNQKESDYEQRERHHRQSIRWTIAGFLALIAYTSITAAILFATAIGNSVSYKSFVSTQRAYMYYAGVTPRKTQAGNGFTYWLAPLFGNSGNTPTVDLLSRANCWPDEKLESDPFNHFRSLNDKWIEGFYGPKVILRATDCSLTSQLAANVKDGHLHYYLAGETTYRDSVAHPSPMHVTQFAVEFTIDQLELAGGGLSGAAAQRGHHNCADDGCPK